MPTISFNAPAITNSACETSDGGEKRGTLTAIDFKAKGKIQRQHEMEDPLINCGAGVNAPVSYAVAASSTRPWPPGGNSLRDLRQSGSVAVRTGGLAAHGVHSKTLRLALIPTASNTVIDMSYGSSGEARL
jgi:hypothetical protein